MPAKSDKKAMSKKPAKLASKPVKATKSARTPKKESALGSIKKMLGMGVPANGKAKKTAPLAQTQGNQSKKTGKSTAAPIKGKVAATPVAQPQKGPKSAAGAKTGKAGALPAKEIKTSVSLAARKEAATHGVPGGPPVCREVACELMCTTGGYCRMHYIKNWKKIKRKEMILKEKKLNHYIEELVSKYPDKYIEAIRQDLASEKDFAKVIADLEIEEGMDDFESVDTETAEGIIDNLKRDFEDEGDPF